MNETVKPETDVSAEPDTEATSTQDDGLDSILNEWDTSQEAKADSPPSPTQPPDQSREALIAEVTARLNAERDYDRFLEDFASSVSDLPFEVNQGVINGWMNDRAKTDPRINTAYLAKDTNPAGWKKVFAGLTEEFKGQFSVKEQPTTADNDKAAAIAFVKGSSTKVEPETPISNKEISGMTDNEFLEYQRKQFGI